MKLSICCLYAGVIIFCGDTVSAYEPLTENNTAVIIEYELVDNWPQLSPGFELGNPTGMAVDSRQHVFVFHRAYRKWPLLGPMPDSLIAANTILELDRHSGTIINSWGNNTFVMPHGLAIDKDDNIWVTDVVLHQVFKFSHDGKLLMTLGEAGVEGKDALHFNMPTDVAVANSGSFYVSDGYGNSRVIKFSSDGKFLFAWGRKGTAQGKFDIPHAVTLDENGNVYVADRENKRIQVFDSTGKFLKQLPGKGFGNIYSVTYHQQHIFSVDCLRQLTNIPVGSDVTVFDMEGNIASRFGRTGSYNGPVCMYHDVTVDNEGSLYVGDIYGNRIQKFKKTTIKN